MEKHEAVEMLNQTKDIENANIGASANSEYRKRDSVLLILVFTTVLVFQW